MKIQRTVFTIAAFLLIPACFSIAQAPVPQTPVNAKIENNVIVAKLVEGDSLFSKILQIANYFSVSSGIILSDVGQLRNFSLSQYNPISKRFVAKSYKTPFELISFQGTIGVPSDGFVGMHVNCQATLADSSMNVIAGHLANGIVSVSNQLVILRLKELNLIKEYNIHTGVWEINITR
jgi:predicted DNA-binding protein with PD1-like motif